MSPVLFREHIRRPRTVVVKVGSRIVTAKSDPDYLRRMAALAEDIARLRRQGIHVVLVSSGAIAHGMERLGLNRRPSTIPLKQACAGIGQIRLMTLYHEQFALQDIPVGQVLLTWDDLRDKRRYLNLRNTLHQLLEYGAVPVINENDSVGTEEIRFGENDTLGAQIALLLNADLYVMLTDVNGLYDENPATSRTARQIPLVARLTPELRALASGSRDEISVGGMETKIKAAEIVIRSGACALIGNGFTGRLADVLGDTAYGTLFLPGGTKLSASHRWIAYTRAVSGVIVVDGGAQRAILKNGKSLLPAGVKSVRGPFKPGDTVNIQTEEGQVVARGLVNYSSDEVAALKGRRSAEIQDVLGYKSFDEVVHRDNLVLL